MEYAHLLTNLGLLATLHEAPPPRRTATAPNRKGNDMRSYNCEDHKKFVYALCARDIRRLAAMVDRASLDVNARSEIDCALEQLEARLFLFWFADDATGRFVGDVDRYSDGRPVMTTINWGHGFATLVHCPDPKDGTSGKTEELSEEVWPTGAETTVADDDFSDPLKIDREDDEE